jgi:poly[(R)-3-hydroxyalkanoate] polymerase subunit PhaC
VDPGAWLAASEEQEGSWWEHWMQWLGERSGELRVAPARLGSLVHPPIEPAPGSYVRTRASEL